MSNTTNLMAVTLTLALAGTAMADRPTPIYGPFIETSSGFQAPARPAEGGLRNIIAEYNFANGELNVRHTSYTQEVIVADPTLANLEILAIEAIGITARTYHNQGAGFENWASELRLGLRIMLNGAETTGGAAPFSGVNSGPAGGQGTYLDFTGGSYGPFDLTGEGWSTPASGFVVGGWTTYNDGTGLPSHTITEGILRVTMVPAPGSAALLAIGGMVAFRRRRA